MKIFTAGAKFLILICILAISMLLLGCGMTITQQAAQRAVADAQVAVSDARASRARFHSTDKMKKAERLLKEAEEAISRGRRQRAYTLAMRAEESARAAQKEAMTYLEDSGIRTREYAQTPVRSQAGIGYDSPPLSRTTPQMQERAISTGRQMPSGLPGYEMPPQQMPGFATPDDMLSSPDQVTSDTQVRIKNAVKTLEEAQNAVSSARAMIAKAQVEIGLALSDLTIQQLRLSGASAETLELVNSWYDYAYRAVEAGNYEEASRAVKRAQGYAQSFSRPTK